MRDENSDRKELVKTSKGRFGATVFTAAELLKAASKESVAVRRRQRR